MKRILFVDDEVNLLEGLRRMLRPVKRSWEMEFVTSGPAALLAFEEKPFDVVVSDLRMPGMDGAELLAQIQAQYPSTARIILSGHSEADLAAKAHRLACRVLAKPCAASELTAAIFACAAGHANGRLVL
jgi:DNA-binding NtrC family response regulator